MGAWWQQRDRDARVALVGISVLVAGAIGVRVWLMAQYGPAFLGFPDSAVYAFWTIEGSFRDLQHPAGYSLFLRALEHLSNNLSFTIAVQHATGIATGLLLYKAVGRTGAPAWLGLLPAAVVFFGGTGLLLEHSLLSDSLLSFLQALSVYFAIRSIYDHRVRWSLLTGIAIGLSIWVKSAAISTAILIPVLLLCATQGGARRKLQNAAITSIAVIVAIGAYVGIQDLSTGYLGYARQGAWALYGRVVTFVDCSKFTPPYGTRFLCPSEPPGHRASQDYFVFASTAPAVRRFGPNYFPTPQANAPLEAFSVAAIEHEPVAYVEAVAGGLGRYVLPRGGEGDTPQQLRESLLQEVHAIDYTLDFDRLYPRSHSYTDSAAQTQPLSQYESYTRVQGPLLIFLLAVAVAGPFCLPRRMRWAAGIFTLTALASITFAVATDGYDARYAYPTFGPLAAGAALGIWGIRVRLLDVIQRRRAVAGPEVSLDPSRTM
jgi:hypothetical protein